MQQYFLNQNCPEIGATFALEKADSHHLFTVMRAQAAEKAKSTDVDKVREAMAGQTFAAPSGYTLTMDKTKRRKALLKAEKILIDQEAISPLYHMGQAWMIRPNIKNLVFNGEYPDFKTTYAVKN